MTESTKLKMSGVTKVFPGVRALDDVSITARVGKVLGLVGVNGAGKSTLMNILGGIHRPTAGRIEIDGREVALHSPKDASHAGIAFIHQELLYFPTLTVAENMFISDLPAAKRLPFAVDKAAARAAAEKYLAMLGSDIPPSARMEELSVGEKQVVEIARALTTGSDIVILDEPTSSLSIREKEGLFAIVRKLRAEGKTIIYISHFLEEILELADTYFVLRNGRLAGSGDVKDVTKGEIVSMIVGREIEALAAKDRQQTEAPLLHVEGIQSGDLLRGVNFSMKQGEVLGLWGLMGSGRTELIRAILGLDPMSAGQLKIVQNGQVRPITPAQLLARTAYVTESRGADGLFLEEPVWKNISAPTLGDYARGWLKVLETREEVKTTKDLIAQLGIRTPGHQTRISNLSGGNQQKVVFAKWLKRRPEILILDEPTRGVDIGAKREIGELVINLARVGAAILLVTSEVEEMVALSDRVLVLKEGTIAEEIVGEHVTEPVLMAAAMGALAPNG
jgi:ABC-type sugar transport system ATPase subunit